MALKIAKLTENRSREYYETLAIKAFESGDLEAAARNLISALEKDGENAGLFLRLAAVFLEQKKPDKALIAVKRSIELSPYEADAYNVMGIVLFQHEFWGAAEKFFHKAISLSPEHATAKKSLVETKKQLRSGDNEPPAEFDSIMALLEIQEPRLSLCMIAKNEEAFIGDCLASIREIVDEIIVVDTGSTDRTIEIAESYGAKVFHYPWQGDFASARNESLAHASGDWILVLDADEMVPAEGHTELRHAIRNKENVGYALVIENLLGEEGQEYQTALIFRLFQNRPDIRYEGIIHEQAMLAAQRTGLPIRNLHTRIIHRGYLNQYVLERDKYQRNLAILLRQVEEEPRNPYVYFNLGQTYKLLERYDESEQAYRDCLRLLDELKESPTTPYWLTAYFSLADLFRLTGEIEKGLEVAEEGLRRYPEAADILFTKGLLLTAAGRFQEAIADFQACRAFAGRIYAAGNDPAVPTYKSSQALGNAYAHLGEYAVAKQHYLQALQEWGKPNDDLFMNLGIVHLQLGEHQAALQYFIQTVELNDRNSKAWGNIGFLCQQFGNHEESLAARRKAYELEPQTHGFVYGTALLHARFYAEAEYVFSEQTESNADHAPGWIYLGLTKLCLGDWDGAMRTWQELAIRPDVESKSQEDVSALLRFARLLQGELLVEDEVNALTLRDGEFWALVVSHLILAERYADAERALQVLGSLTLTGLDLSLGRMLLQHELHEEAMGYLLKAREQAPDMPEVYVLLGEAAEGLGNIEDAQVMYQMALSLDPKQVAVRQRLGRLRLMAPSK